jgi:hypothetical protein
MGNCSSGNNNKQRNIKGNQIIKNSNNQKNNKLKSVPQKKNNIGNEIEKEKIKKVKISIIDLDKNENILNLSFDENLLLKDICDKINYDKNKDYNILNENDEEINNKKEMKIKEIFPNINNINLKIKYSGLEIPQNIKNSYIENTKFIGSLILDNLQYLGISILNISNEKMLTYHYSNEKFKELRKFNLFSAICNGKNNLYISGGENNGSECLSDFYEINLANVNKENIQMRKLTNLIEGRTWHSMIYIPNKYIFIVGGIGNKNVELYDIENNIIQKDSELNEERSECSLCMVNDIYLYAFCGFLIHQNFTNSFERCNLRKQIRKWEMVNYKLENNVIFNPSFFGVGYYKDKILLLGGNENNEEKNDNYIISIGINGNEDSIEDFSSNEQFINVYREKFFIPFNNDYSLIIPLISNNSQVLFLNNEEGKITRKEYNDYIDC